MNMAQVMVKYVELQEISFKTAKCSVSPMAQLEELHEISFKTIAFSA